jgi:phosphoadenosine phosphosulfate reductase
VSALPQSQPADPIDTRLAAIQGQLDAYRQRGLRLFATSSFGIHSAVLLHIVSRLAPEVPVFFLDTGYHFPETLAYRAELERRLGIAVRDLRAPAPRAEQVDAQGGPLFASDPDRCCHLNKVLPLESVLSGYHVWINGVRGAQTSVRQGFAAEEAAPHGVIRYHPLLDWTAQMMSTYRQRHGLPPHPLAGRGFGSVGCQPCTRAVDAAEDERDGRWPGSGKTECGLHTTLLARRP